MTDTTRRKVLLGAASLLSLSATSSLVSASQATPRASRGPFYPTDLPLDDDNDLAQVTGQTALARGKISHLSGRLLDLNGRPLQGARIEIWQCDANGRYRHPRDPGQQPIDPGFQGFGHSLTNAEGRYRFRTIRPVPYPGRTPHIHVAVRLPGSPAFVTQLYVAGEQANDADFLYRRIPVEKRPMVTAEFTRADDAEADLQASWDIVLDSGRS